MAVQLLQNLILRLKQWRGRTAVRVAAHPQFQSFPARALEGSVWQRFEEIASIHSEKVALIQGTEKTSYRQLRKQALNIGRFVLSIYEKDEAPEAPRPLAIMLKHDARMVPPILGAIWAGRPYVFLDPAMPEERLRLVITDSAASALLTRRSLLPLAQRIAPSGTRVITLEQATAEKEGLSPGQPKKVTPDHPLCINYTSGTTSRPSGVIRNHRALLANIRTMTNISRISSADTLSCLISPAFGAAAMDIFGALLNGATLAPYDVRRNGVQLLPKWIEENAVTFYHSVPTLFRSLASAVEKLDQLVSIRFVLLGGEQVFASDLEAFQALFPKNAALQNVLGMTEGAGILCSFLANHESCNKDHRIPVGYPVAGKQVWIAGEDGKPVPAGTPGEIVVQSRLLSSGYLNLHDATLKRFRKSNKDARERLLFTGDMGIIRLDDGALVWLGRRDSQIKVGGVRVSPAEVEAALQRFPGIQEAAVTVVTAEENTQGAGSTLLLAWYVPAGSSYVDHDQLRQSLARELPADALPGRFISLTAMPMLPNGKIDRQALNLRHPMATLRRSFLPTAPRNATEEMVAQAFSKALGIAGVGAYDHFFELGGDSLAVVNALGILSTQIGRELPTDALLSHPTVASLAEMLLWAKSENQTPAPRSGHTPAPAVLTLREAGSRPPAYICPGGTGSENELISFAKMLALADLDRPLHGVRISAYASEILRMGSLSELATLMIDAIWNAHPHGPWVLIGECGSSLLAMEMVNQIQVSRPDRMPEHILLFDSRTNTNLFKSKQRQDIITETQWPHHVHYLNLLLDWECPAFDFHIHLVTSEEFLATSSDPTLGWGEMAKSDQQLHLYRAPGDHLSYIRQNAHLTAKILQDILA